MNKIWFSKIWKEIVLYKFECYFRKYKHNDVLRSRLEKKTLIYTVILLSWELFKITKSIVIYHKFSKFLLYKAYTYIL